MGKSFTGLIVTVIDDVLLLTVPSLATNVNVSVPLAFGLGV